MGYIHAGKGDTMDNTVTIIKKVTPLEYNKLIIETNAGERYFSDLSFFQKVYCYPQSGEWDKVSIDNYGLDLLWPTRFEVHITQIIDSSYKVEKIKRAG
jgi:hypothetical protein